MGQDTPRPRAPTLPSLLSGLGPRLTVLVHALLQTLLQPAGLALVPVGLVHRAHPRSHLAPAGRTEPRGVSVPPPPGPGLWGLAMFSPVPSSLDILRPHRPHPRVPQGQEGQEGQEGRGRGGRASRPPPVAEPPAHGPLEEAAAAVAGVDAVVLPAAAVSTHAALQRWAHA